MEIARPTDRRLFLLDENQEEKPGGCERMLKDGMAWHYTEFDKSENHIKTQKRAKKKKVGLWATSNPVPPWTWRATHKTNKGDSVLGPMPKD